MTTVILPERTAEQKAAPLPDTYAAAKAMHRANAERDFSEHVITGDALNGWRCGRPKSGFYSFHVIVRPGMVCIYGDIGEGIFRGGEPSDMLGWLRGAVESLDYLASKLQPQRKEFYPGDAFAFAREMLADNEARDDERYAKQWRTIIEEAEDLQEDGMLDGRAWGGLVYEHAPGSDAFDVGTDYASDTLWLIEALRWFVAHLLEGGAL